MFFFQDDIGLLIQIHATSFLRFLFMPQAEHFAPILHALSWWEYRFFGWSFENYVVVSVFFHIAVVVVLGALVYSITKNAYAVVVAVLLFFINNTYTESFLWFAAQGILLSTLFVGLAFICWYLYMNEKNKKNLLLSLVFLGLASFSFGSGVAVGIVFSIASILITNTKIKQKVFLVAFIYLAVGVLSYVIGPVITNWNIGRVTPEISSVTGDGVRIVSFVVVGIARGVVGRVFLPGFEPEREDLIGTAISFLPFILIVLISIWTYLKTKVKQRTMFVGLIPFIIYPYLWAGFLRYQFGLKQALAERYAYPSLFFFAIFLAVFVHILVKKKMHLRIIIGIAMMLTLVQAGVFMKKAAIFEERPRQTKEYILKLQSILEKHNAVIDLPLPSFINQEYSIRDLAPLLTDNNIEFVDPNQFCTGEIRQVLVDKNTHEFYLIESRDPIVSPVFSSEMLLRCIERRQEEL